MTTGGGDATDRRSAVDDSGYVRQIIMTIQGIYKIDPRRIYVTGHSNGGYMSHRMACDHSDLIAGRHLRHLIDNFPLMFCVFVAYKMMEMDRGGLARGVDV